jgi:NAD+ synthase
MQGERSQEMIKDFHGLINQTTMKIRAFTDCAVLGLSGGADSTLVAILCAMALGQENVYAVGMPYGDLDKQTFNSRSEKVAKRLSIHYSVISIKEAVDAIVKNLKSSIPDMELNQIGLGNIKARIRMANLYGLSGYLASEGTRYRVMGTGNFSEDFIGYDTKGGDALADLFPIGSLFKSEIYQLLDHFIHEGLIEEGLVDRVPSAGLWEGQTDEGELGHTYAEMEPAIIQLIGSYDPFISTPRVNVLIEEVRQRHLANKHKHMAPPVINLRKWCDWNDPTGYFGS